MSKETPRVSVIIPTYNRGDLVTQAVESVLEQTFADFEIIVVDDGSTDGTRKALVPMIPPVKYVGQENRGLAAARNRGIAESSGEFLAFLDSDDLWEPRFLEATLETFEKHPDAGAVFTAEREIGMDNRPGKRTFTKRSPGIYFDAKGMLSDDTRVGCGRPPVVRREWIDRLGGFEESIRTAVDVEMWIRYSFHMPMVLQPEPLVLRRIHPATVSADQERNARVWLKILERLAREHPEFVRENRMLYRRSLAKQYLRLGREMMARMGGDRGSLPDIRAALRRSVAAWPFLPRAHAYLAVSYIAPGKYGRWRRWELQRRGL